MVIWSCAVDWNIDDLQIKSQVWTYPRPREQAGVTAQYPVTARFST